MRNTKKNNRKKKTAIIVLLTLIAATGALELLLNPVPPPLSYELLQEEGTVNPLTGRVAETLPSRPIMVSTDNVGDAIPQYGISSADIIYEVPVEGAQSRLEAIYYSKMPEVVGPCRSVRPCIVDLAREYNAILVHDGWSPAAKKYLAKGLVADLPAQTQTFYYRTSAKAAPHNELAKTKSIWKAAKAAGFDEAKEVRSFSFMEDREVAVLKGREEEYLNELEKELEECKTDSRQKIILPDFEGITFAENKEASKISVTYVNCAGVFKYNEETGNYVRSVNGGAYKDLNNGKEIKVKNVIVYKVSSDVLDYKGRLDIDMCAGGKAWVFTAGKVFKCTWEKADLDSPTIFKDADGNEIKLTKGKTWINIIDGNSKFEYK